MSVPHAPLENAPAKLETKLEGESMESERAGQALHVLAFNFDLKTSGQAGNRFVGYEIAAPTGQTLVEVLTPALAKANNTYGICSFIGAPHDEIEGSRTIVLPLANLLLPKGVKLNLIAPFKQSEDTFPLFRWVFEYVNVT